VRIPIEENPNLLLDFRHLEHLEVHLPLLRQNKREKEEPTVHQKSFILKRKRKRKEKYEKKRGSYISRTV